MNGPGNGSFDPKAQGQVAHTTTVRERRQHRRSPRLGRDLLVSVVAVALTGTTACWGGDDPSGPRPPPFEELREHPVLDLRIPGTEAGEVTGSSGAGDNDDGRNAESRAQRPWVSTDGADIVTALASAVIAAREAGVEMVALLCNPASGLYVFTGSYWHTNDDDGRERFEVRVRLGSTEPSTVTIEVIADETMATRPGGSSDTVDGDCPPALADLV